MNIYDLPFDEETFVTLPVTDTGKENMLSIAREQNDLRITKDGDLFEEQCLSRGEPKMYISESSTIPSARVLVGLDLGENLEDNTLSDKGEEIFSYLLNRVPAEDITKASLLFYDSLYTEDSCDVDEFFMDVTKEDIENGRYNLESLALYNEWIEVYASVIYNSEQGVKLLVGLTYNGTDTLDLDIPLTPEEKEYLCERLNERVDISKVDALHNEYWLNNTIGEFRGNQVPTDKAVLGENVPITFKAITDVSVPIEADTEGIARDSHAAVYNNYLNSYLNKVGYGVVVPVNIECTGGELLWKTMLDRIGYDKERNPFEPYADIAFTPYVCVQYENGNVSLKVNILDNLGGDDHRWNVPLTDAERGKLFDVINSRVDIEKFDERVGKSAVKENVRKDIEESR